MMEGPPAFTVCTERCCTLLRMRGSSAREPGPPFTLFPGYLPGGTPPQKTAEIKVIPDVLVALEAVGRLEEAGEEGLPVVPPKEPRHLPAGVLLRRDEVKEGVVHVEDDGTDPGAEGGTLRWHEGHLMSRLFPGEGSRIPR